MKNISALIALLSFIPLATLTACQSEPKPEATAAAVPVGTATAAPGMGYAHHPDSVAPFFLEASAYETLKKQLAQPPAPGSLEQKRDEKELRKLQKSRTAADCERAQSEVRVNLKTLFGAPAGTLQEPQIEAMNEFFDMVRNDANFIVQKMKVDFPRPRPYEYIAGLEPCAPKEVSKAYPSGHATISRLYALILSDLFPAHKGEFMARAEQVAKDRVLAGVHHPTDIENGRKVADLIYKELKKSEKFQAKFQAASKASQ